MSYQVLARKWRPNNFSELVGQEHVVAAISNALDNDRLHHAYLFTGTRGVGKTTIARIFSKSLNCELGMGSKPCGKCSTCVEIEQGNFVDLLEIDAASRTKVEDTRELLDNVQYRPSRGRYKVYLIDEVHMLSKHSFNALLKTLEEPPPHVKFLLATTDPQKLPITILSRCLQFNLKALSRAQIAQQLQHVFAQEQLQNAPEALAQIARAAQGSMRDALSLSDQAIAQGNGNVSLSIVTDMLGLMDKTQVLKLLNAVLNKQNESVFELVDFMSEQAVDYSQVLNELMSLLHQVALTQFVPDACKLETISARAIYQLAKNALPEHIQLLYQIALQGKRDMPFAADARTGLEMTLLRMLAFSPVQVNTSVEELVAMTPSSAPSSGPSSAPLPMRDKHDLVTPTDDTPVESKETVVAAMAQAEEAPQAPIATEIDNTQRVAAPKDAPSTASDSTSNNDFTNDSDFTARQNTQPLEVMGSKSERADNAATQNQVEGAAAVEKTLADETSAQPFDDDEYHSAQMQDMEAQQAGILQEAEYFIQPQTQQPHDTNTAVDHQQEVHQQDASKPQSQSTESLLALRRKLTQATEDEQENVPSVKKSEGGYDASQFLPGGSGPGVEPMAGAIPRNQPVTKPASAESPSSPESLPEPSSPEQYSPEQATPYTYSAQADAPYPNDADVPNANQAELGEAPPWATDDANNQTSLNEFNDINDINEVTVNEVTGGDVSVNELSHEALALDEVTVPVDAQEDIAENQQEIENTVFDPTAHLAQDLECEVDYEVPAFLESGEKVTIAPQLDKWSALITQMQVAALTKQLALHSEFTQDGDKVVLNLVQTKEHLNTDSAKEQLQRALSDVLQQQITLEVHVGDAINTPFALQQSINRVRFEYAKQVVETNESICMFKDMFNAQVLNDSIKAR
ncbi:DNA polymerase III, tau subunit / DNA polymerase III, gamma subunit [Paraglaciecola sp. T6c]|uniref:DNA polymerase III subunit gamma/tau n=1 Tax=Pseudoalteromonas atlantica (strain T6c / ATCC BAA-1087) TaxID=3042615 RepID=UPI00005C70B0|nr:DNA polymerase III subunit gamma/tau [Paraglaciecola sp. T6c]ABG41405.1 DNA polymerase III, tau subunit / DNA polymerase III, gamma subunit [Paraglaciecola sp. T6c]